MDEGPALWSEFLRLLAEEYLNGRGKSEESGWPDAVKAWPTLVKRFGKLSLKEDLEPAIRYAEEGYPVGVLLGEMWERSTAQYHQRLDNGVLVGGCESRTDSNIACY